MIAEIISVGTELLLGNILNSNARYLSEQCADLGLSVYYQTVVGDNEFRLRNLLEQALKRSDILILTGGLGPTQDDLTKEVVAKVLKRNLIKDQETEDRLYEMFQRRNIKMALNNLKQALIPEGAIVLKNSNGTAPGLIITDREKAIVLLPGPPKEMIPLFQEHVVPFIRKRSPYLIYSKVLKIVGIGESSAEEMLLDLIEGQTNPTIAPYAKDGEVHFRLTAKAETEEKALEYIKPLEEEIIKRLNHAVYTCESDKNLEDVVVELLNNRGLSLAIAESCTGGMLSSTLVNVSGISSVLKESIITYSNDSKMKYLGVSEKTLNQFGAVSKETAEEMVRGMAKAAGADVAVAVTGIAGPNGGSVEKPVGLVYIGCYVRGKSIIRECRFGGNRQKVRFNTVIAALNLLRLSLLEEKQ